MLKWLYFALILPAPVLYSQLLLQFFEIVEIPNTYFSILTTFIDLYYLQKVSEFITG